MGSRDHPDFALPSDSLEKTSNCLIKNQLINDKTKESDAAPLERIISKFYGDSGFRHFGYWRVGINDAKAACENLMDEILAFIPKVKGLL